MPTNYSGRITLIVGLLWLSLSAIFPQAPVSLFRVFKISAPVSWRLNLKPGIDMVGGTSLLYQIEQPEGEKFNPDLADQVATALKRRVDPQGVKNLIWRPQGNRLEIQMPLSGRAKEAEPVRAAYLKAQQNLEVLNVRPAQAKAAAEITDPARRAARLKELAHGSPAREKILKNMADTADRIAAARKAQNAADQAQAELDFEKLQTQLAATNVAPDELQRVLDLKTDAQTPALAKIKERAANFPQELAAINGFQSAYAAYDGVKDSLDSASALKRDLKGSGVLEYHILATLTSEGGPVLDVPQNEFDDLVKQLKTQGPRAKPGAALRWYKADQPEEFRQGKEGPPRLGAAIYNGDVYVLAYADADHSLTDRKPLPWSLSSASEGADPANNHRIVRFEFDVQGGRYFGDLTGRFLPRPDGSRYLLGMMLDDKIVSAPSLNSRISGSGEISGGQDGFKKSEVDYLVNTLNAGSLPARLTDEPIRERTVGPQLGADNLRAGLIACLLGLVAVAVFMIGYYYVLGLVATLAVLMNVLMIFGAMAALNATFTLPAVAGIVLTIGMAVDANVLIYERLREELDRGLSMRMAMRNAYERAWSAIIDGSLTTAITSLFLLWLGSEEVRGFAVTLLIGLASSLFTSLFVTRTVFGVLMDKFNFEHFSSIPNTFPAFGRFLNPNINWVKLTKPLAVFSAIFIGVGCTLFGIRLHQGRVLDIEFTSGTSAQFTLKQPLRIEEVRKLIDAESAKEPKILPAPGVVSVGSDSKSYEVVTPNADTVAVKNAVIAAMGDRLNIALPSTFAKSDQPYAKVAGTEVVPIEPGQSGVGEFAPENLPSFVGGAAVLLRDIEPAVDAQSLRGRIDQQRLAASGGQDVSRRRMDVTVSPDGHSAAVLFYDPDVEYTAATPQKQAEWASAVAAPAWDAVTQALTKPADLQGVSKFGAQVAGEAQFNALVALVLSLFGIVAYIWLRFGNLAYGAGSIIALIHDTLFTIAAVGFAHYLSYVPGVSEFLLLEPFRLNLTLLAAILTVIGYSMNDTVVVFDRIRENRGKSGALTGKLVNDSINQTLSRTLLTAGTTMLTVVVMYLFGGSGIHGFAFAMMVGIFVGTYSSIAIASPVLLWNRPEVPADSKRGEAAALQRA